MPIPPWLSSFDTVEGEAEAIFGEYLDGEITVLSSDSYALLVWFPLSASIFFAGLSGPAG